MALYAIRERTEDEARNGPYIRLVLTNRNGTVNAVYWQVPDDVKRFCSVGTVIDVNGELGEYKGEPQLKISSCYHVPPDEIHYEELLPVSPYDRTKQRLRFEKLIHGLPVGHIQELLTMELLYDWHTNQAYSKWPAAVMNHHAWVGGLMDHSIEVAEIALATAAHWPSITNTDILVAGALLHDIGKLMEIDMGSTFEFTTQGRLSGHCLLGIQWLRATAENRHLPAEAYTELEHIIASHHGQPEFGAITTPKTANALVIHLADMASVKMTMATQAIKGHSGPGLWTPYDRATKTQYLVPQIAQNAPSA